MHAAPRRKSTAIGLVAAAGLALSGLAAIPATASTTVTHSSINDPTASGSITAGNVTLTGAVTQGSDDTTTVLYIVDATHSTHDPAPGCAADDLDGGGVNVLECEIGAVSQLNANLAAGFPLGGLVVGVEAFATPDPKAPIAPTQVAQLADLNTSGQLFASPSDTGGGALPRIITAVRGIRQGEITAFTDKKLSGGGTGLDPAIDTALAALKTAPAGPKWIMLLSDGKAPVSGPDAPVGPDRLKAVTDYPGGVHLSSFAVGTSATCGGFGSLTRLAAAATAGHGVCVSASPDHLAGVLTGAQPDFLANNGVTVRIGSSTVVAQLNAVGGWQASFSLGQGTYTATSEAQLTSGPTVVAPPRTFSVGASSAPGGPPPGSVSPGPGALLATAVHVNLPAPSRAALPTRVTGSVGLPTKHSLVTTKQLEGATVLLQGRKSVGATWVTLGHSTVKAGKYSLHWKPLRSIHLLRVSLLAHGNLAGSAMAVPVANISSCVLKRHPSSFSMTCHTTATNGSKVWVYKGKHVVGQAKVAGGLVKVHASGKPGPDVLVVRLSRKHHAPVARLAL